MIGMQSLFNCYAHCKYTYDIVTFVHYYTMLPKQCLEIIFILKELHFVPIESFLVFYKSELF